MADISFMGAGSGLLDSKMLDAYKDDYERVSIKPLTDKMQKNLDKQKSLLEIINLAEDLKREVKKFSDSDTYSKRTTKVTGTGVSATISPGIPLQDITIKVDQIAKNDITQLNKRFESRDSAFSTTNTNLRFNHDGNDYNISIRAGQSVGSVAQAITDATDGKVLGIMMKTGGNQPYQLMVQSKESGQNNRVYFGNTTRSGIISQGELKGSFDLKLKDSQNKDITLSIDLSKITKMSNSSQDNALAIKTEIEKQIGENAELKKLYDGGVLNFDVFNQGKNLVINDRRGYGIGVSSDSDILSKINLKSSNVTSDDIRVSTLMKDKEQLTGVITIGGVKINLADVTSTAKTGKENLQAIVDKVNSEGEKSGIKAVLDGNELVVNNTEGTFVQVVLDGKNSREQNAKIISSLGLSGGSYSSYQNALKDVGIKTIQKAQDAKFSWNGIEVSRPKNTIDDVVTGITVELTKPHTDKDSSVIRITNDDDKIFEGVDKFVEAYNALIAKVTETTRYDRNSTIQGVFYTESSIRGIINSLKGILNFSAGTSNVSMSSYGFSIKDDGKLAVDKKVLEEKYKKDREAALAFFRGGEVLLGGTEIEIKPGEFKRLGGSKTKITGFFVQFENVVKGLVDGDKSTLKNYEKSLKDEYKSADDEKKRQQDIVKQRTNSMKAKLIAYDIAIGKMQDQMRKLQALMGNSDSK